ncbi:hypothetical protein SKP08_002127 [Vibrio fluvialis]|nr:hypothetical protein [Vibrio fluvialis]
MKENTRIELTQDQYDALSSIGVADCEIKTIGCTMSIGGPSSDHHMTVGIKTRATGGNHTIDNIDTTPIQFESLAGGAEWNGEGLPPVGVECRYFVANKRDYPTDNHLREVTCVAHVGVDNQLAVLVSRDFTFSTVCNDAWVRPIETEAERNERERLEGIDAMYMAIADYSGSPVRNSDTWRDCEALYSAGYRKAVTNE